MNWSKEEIEKTIALCKKEAMTNGAFRAKILKDPAAAIKELTGKDLPDGLTLQILEQDPKANFAFVLPPPLPEELTDEELDGSFGGCTNSHFDWSSVSDK